MKRLESRQALPLRDEASRHRRPRSPSRIRQPYTSNCSRRLCEWPPSPKVEDVRVEDEIPMRGRIGQDPMIIDVLCGSDTRSTSSSDKEISEPKTPPSSGNDPRDGQYSWESEQNISTPIGKKPDNSTLSGSYGSEKLANNTRGRNTMPKLDTDFDSRNGLQLERERSPYASGPQGRKSRNESFSGEYLLSPDVKSPKLRSPHTKRSHSHCSHQPAEPLFSQARDSPIRPIRPPLGRHASAIDPATVAYPSDTNASPSGANLRRSRRPTMESQRAQSYHIPQTVDVHSNGRHSQKQAGPRQCVRPSLDERNSTGDLPKNLSSTNLSRSDLGSYRDDFSESDSDSTGIRITPGKPSPQMRMRPSDGYYRKGKQELKGSGSKISDTRRSLSTANPESPPVNLKSLVSGEGIQQILNATALNAAINSNPAITRRASPRPSPRPSPSVSPLASPHTSPTGSPYASPPRTPPNGRRTNHMTSLKTDSSASRPSSPLSSHSSNLTQVPSHTVGSVDTSERQRPLPPTSRHITPQVLPPVKSSEENLAPGIVVRSPSPLPVRYEISLSTETGNLQHRQSEDGTTTSKGPYSSSTLKPKGFSARRRSASSADVRPKLTVDPSSFPQALEPPLSPSIPVRGSSPGLMSPGDRYKPAYLNVSSPTAGSNSPRTEAFPPAQRSRSQGLSPASPGPRSHSALPSSPIISRPRATSSASGPVVLASPSRPLKVLPTCPRPKRVAGYNDWYTLKHNSAFAICPDCRENVFGIDTERYLSPKTVSSSRKTQCDLNNPWIRLSCLLRGPDVNLLGALSEITLKEQECPEDYDEPRDWYRLEDPETKKHICNFYACPQCVQSLEVVFPSWHNVFYRSHSSHIHKQDLKKRPCSLRSSPFRFADYLDMLCASVTEVEKKKTKINTEPVTNLAKQLAAITECPRDKMLPQKSWHVHAHMPEFTICQECYEDVIYPLARDDSAIAANFDKQPHKFPNPTVEACCQLYSRRMRKVFREACEEDDWEHLKQTAMKRHMLQQDILGTLVESAQSPNDDEIKERLGELLEEWKKKE